MSDLYDVLRANNYPGRGLVLAGTETGPAVAAFLTGRSPASQDRRLKPGPDASLAAVATSGTGDEDLRHYVAAVRSGSWFVVPASCTARCGRSAVRGSARSRG